MATESKPAQPLVFYDITSRPPVEETCFSPNPWKTRLALNFKNLPYSTKWVPLPNIPKVRQGLGVPACRKFGDGTDFYTLPIVEDPSADAIIGDSFDIAVHLQKTYPDSGAGDLFPPQPLDYTFRSQYILVPLSDCNNSEFPEYAKFNVNIDAAFTAHVQLTVDGFPFDPDYADATKAEFVRRAGVQRWEDFSLAGEAREKMKDSFREMLGDLLPLFATGGPFLLGAKASYADLCIGAWLHSMYVTLPKSEWEEVMSWHGGFFGRFFDALDVYAQVK